LSFTQERARLAALTRHHPDKPELADASRRQIKMLRAERFIAGLTGSEPALTPLQLAHLAGLLQPERGGRDA
jgi:hypothetical protein